MTVKRFRTRTVNLPGEVGDRVIFHPEELVEEWDTVSGFGRTFVPSRLYGGGPRVGLIQRTVQRRRPGPGDLIWETICEDEHPRPTRVGVILTVIGPKQLVEVEEMIAFLDFLAGTRLTTLEQRVAVGTQAAPWLRVQCRDLAHVRHIPDYPAPESYAAWLDGYETAVGQTRLIPGCPIEFDLPPVPDPGRLEVQRTVVREDAIDRLRQGGGFN